jgi:hypothetical protein
MTFEESEMKKAEEAEEEETADQLTQLIHVFTQGALMDVQGDQSDDKVIFCKSSFMYFLRV